MSIKQTANPQKLYMWTPGSLKRSWEEDVQREADILYTSAELLMGEHGGESRSLLKSMGYTDDELNNRPVIGIANSWSTVVPGHYNLRELAKFVERGIYRGGGTAVEFGVMSACDGIANGHDGMKYILPSREIICSSVEITAKAHRLDGLILLASCDKIIPGMLMSGRPATALKWDMPAWRMWTM